MYQVTCADCFYRTDVYKVATSLAMLLANHCGEVAEVTKQGKAQFRAAPTGGTF